MSRNEYKKSSFEREGTMDLFIETLTGTAFEITVSPFDTVMSIKLKIQRVEGIPVTAQHLIYNMQELLDSSCLSDYSIPHGATLKLVLSMRGGPITTRRLPILDDIAWKELRDLVESSREDLFNLPAGSHVTVLVFRDGDQVNLFRVVENEDGTYSPLSDSLSGTSLRNLLEDDSSEEEEFHKRLQENSKTMMKMLDIRAKMEKLSLQKKPKKSATVATKQSVLQSRLGTPAGPKSPELKNPNPKFHGKPHFHLPPIGISPEESTPSSIQNFPKNYFSNWNSFLGSSPTTKCSEGCSIWQYPPTCNHNEKELESKSVVHNESVPPIVPGLPDVNHKRVNRNLSNLRVLPDVKPKIESDYGCSRESVKSIVDGSKSDRELNLPDSHINLVSSSDVTILKEPQGVVTEVPEITSTPRPISVPSHKETAVLVSEVPNDTVTRSIKNLAENNYRLVILDEENRPKTSPENLTEHQKAAQKLCNILNETKWHRRNHQVNLLSASSSHLNLIDSEASNFRQQRPLQGITSETILSSSRQTPLLNAVTRTAKFGRRKSTHAPFTLHQNSNRDTINTISQSKLLLDMTPSSIRNHLSPPLREEKFQVSHKPSNHTTLPLEQINRTKKSIRTRCSVCRKRLNITNIYTCRCEKLFCSAHRYSELHECTYDYKGEGRKLLQQANPLVAASKLPKI